MNSPRQIAANLAGSRYKTPMSPSKELPSKIFATDVFDRKVMKKMLPKPVFNNLCKAMMGEAKIESKHADIIADALKVWALKKHATHYSHWFQPLTGSFAEKHDSFITWETSTTNNRLIEEFSGSQLIQGEPDASSFPSGGLRSTYEARGYTGWDPGSYPFLWTGGDGVTLCIPSVFFSWTGEVLDSKIPLLRSDAKINHEILRLLKLTGIKADHVYGTLGFEQEYFVIDRALKNIRSDLLILGKTTQGALPPKGQELQDHYFGAVKDRILAFMQEFEERALKLGIPVKTRHNEVAPAQHEVAPIFEKSTLSVDHNLILMELMRQIATQRDLAVLLHEKPFHELNGSGKHLNWSFCTSEGLNLLDPSDTPENNLHFLILLVAILDAIWEHNALIRASIGSASNDDRLGGHEAPPPIISVYLGEELERVLDKIEETGKANVSKNLKKNHNLNLSIIPELKQDQTDRNRTSPFAFTGNKFEFRAVGSAASPAFPITVLNATVASSLSQILDKIEAKNSKKNLINTVLPVLKDFIKKSKGVRFSGDNYSKEWEIEAKKRNLPNIPNALDAFGALKDPKTIKAFEKILNAKELESRYEILVENYLAFRDIEIKLLLEMFDTQILPAAIKDLRARSKSYKAFKQVTDKELPEQKKRLLLLSESIEAASKNIELLKIFFKESNLLDAEKKKTLYACQLNSHLEETRATLDNLETLMDDTLWPLPKYRELLWLV